MSKRVLELVKWSGTGLGEAELFARDLSNNNTFIPVRKEHIQRLFSLRGIPLAPISGHDYYVYYDYHPSSGYRTDLWVNDAGNIDFKVQPPKGGVLCAFMSEVIVFTLTDRW